MRDAVRPTISLTAADCFMLALEEKHVKPSGLSHNTCRYLLELDGKLDRETLAYTTHTHPDFAWLASVSPVKKNPFSIPVWKNHPETYSIPVGEYYSDALLPEEMINEAISSDAPPFFRFDLIYRSTGNTALVFSWHHLLMDGYGAVLLLRQLAGILGGQNNPSRLELAGRTKQDSLRWSNLIDATRAKFFIDRISKKPLSTISPKTVQRNSIQKIRVIGFPADETARMDNMGTLLGAQFGRSPLYLACAARAIHQLLKDRGEAVNDFWVPVPRDQRKKGAKGPLIGNHLSFLFYRLRAADLTSLTSAVRAVNDQMVHQIKNRTFADYDILMKFLRRTPLPLYYYWIKGPQGGSLASFLFTVAADHPEDFTHIGPYKIADAWSFPSNIYPPGFTFAFMRFHNRLHLMILYFDDVVTSGELNSLEQRLRHELIEGTEYHE